MVAVVIPEVVEKRWYERMLHNLRAAELRMAIKRKRDDRVFTVDAPAYVRE